MQMSGLFSVNKHELNKPSRFSYSFRKTHLSCLMSWLICLRFSFTRRSRVCVDLIALVWLRGCVGGCRVLRRLIIILHTSWRPVGAGQTSLLLILPLNCEPYIRQLSADVEGSHYENKWFLFQAGSWVNCSLPFYFMAELVGLKLSSNLSSPFPRILWGYWILRSLTVCTCAFAALCFTLLILTRRRFVSSEQGRAPCLSRFMCPAFSENPFPVKSLTPLAVLLLNNCQLPFDDRV